MEVGAAILDTIAHMGYWGIAAALAVVFSFFPFPSQPVLITAGYLAFQGEMSFWGVVAAGTLGGLAGSHVNYFLAMKLGRPLVIRYGRKVWITEERLFRMERFFATYGKFSVFIGLLFPGVGQLITIPAGLARMPYASFLVSVAGGAFFWNVMMVSLGYFFGENKAALAQHKEEVTFALLLGVLAAVTLYALFARRRAIRRGTVRDISVTLTDDLPVWPGDQPFTRTLELSVEEEGVNVSSVSSTLHAGTHIDLPLHYFDGRRGMEKFAPGRFVLPALVAHFPHQVAVEAEDLLHLDLRPGSALLLKTLNSKNGLLKKKTFQENYVYLTRGAAELCVERGVSLVGIDAMSVDRYGEEEAPAHKELLSNGIVVLEGAELSRTAPGRYTLICLPLKIAGAEASPVRAVLLPPGMV